MESEEWSKNEPPRNIDRAVEFAGQKVDKSDHEREGSPNNEQESLKKAVIVDGADTPKPVRANGDKKDCEDDCGIVMW